MEEDDAYDAAVPTRIRSLPVAAGAGIDNSTDAWPRSLEASLGMLSGTPPRSLPSALIRRMSSSVRTGSVDWQALSALPSGSGAQQDLAGTLDGVDESGGELSITGVQHAMCAAERRQKHDMQQTLQHKAAHACHCAKQRLMLLCRPCPAPTTQCTPKQGQ